MADKDNGQKSAKKLPVNFEQSLKRLKELSERLEAEDISLNEAMTLFEEGIKLARDCQNALRLAEQKVQTLIEKDGKIVQQELTEE